ncbi:MAG: hypothetical protein GY946_30580 [bacterium]|nr:hypothetical protein [bacterium]
MSLETIDLVFEERAPSPEVARFLVKAQRTLDTFTESRVGDPITGFVACDFARVWQGLAHVKRAHLIPGNSFLEWGSGLGAVTCLASMLGFEASGIEISQPLVDASEELAAEYEVAAEFVCASYIPEGGEHLVLNEGDMTWIDTSGPSAYDDLGLDINDFDLIFAYPWPGEEHALLDLFEHYASRGAVFMTYNGVEDLRAVRKS